MSFRGGCKNNESQEHLYNNKREPRSTEGLTIDGTPVYDDEYGRGRHSMRRGTLWSLLAFVNRQIG